MEIQAVADRRTSDYAELTRRVRAAGLLDRRHGYYAIKIVLNAVLFAALAVSFVLLGASWWQLAIAAGFAVVQAQMAFIGHDAGHRQIFADRRRNDIVGYAHAALVGLSFGSWRKQHNAHHANPNHEHKDPDVDIPVLSFTTAQARVKQGILRWMTAHQAWLFFPLLLLEAVNLRITAVRNIVTGEVTKRRGVEAASLLAHFVVYFGAVFLVLPPAMALAFIAVHQGVLGVYLGLSFAPNHKGMPTVTDDDELDFLRKQVLTSRNVRGGPVVDVALGGLNYQIEHHLFPSMPRVNLRRAQPIVERFCAERGISYSQSGWLRSYGHVLRYLHEIGAPVR